MQTVGVIEKWYKKLGFRREYDAEFYDALHTIEITADTTIANYNLECTDGKKNLLAFLYMCEALQEKYAQHGIGEEILMDTLSDIVRWCDTWSEIRGELFLGEIGWLSRSMNFYLFKIGRLQYCVHNVTESLTKFGMKMGESYIGVHIPPNGHFGIEECKKSFDMARDFFAKYFPDIKYSYFSCFSWLLDENLKEYLPPESNILRFASMFRIVDAVPADDIIRFVFGANANRGNIDQWHCRSSFAEKIRSAIRDEKVFYEVRGLIER